MPDPTARATRRDADEELARMLDWDGIAAFVAHWESLPLFATERDAAPEERARLHAARLANDPHGLAASLRGVGQGAMAPLHDALPAITAPTTVLAGALDETGLPRARSIAQAIPGARLVVVPSVGHAPHREAPASVLREIAAHLVRHSESCTSEQCATLPVPSPATPARSRS